MSHHTTDEPVWGRVTFIPVPCFLLMSTEAFWTMQPSQHSAFVPQAHNLKGDIHNSVLVNRNNLFLV